jgi:5-methylcytosine-specific restriction endonuclease McrA
MTVDHIFPRSKGGSRYDINNLQPMCEECNSAKGDKIKNEF